MDLEGCAVLVGGLASIGVAVGPEASLSGGCWLDGLVISLVSAITGSPVQVMFN